MQILRPGARVPVAPGAAAAPVPPVAPGANHLGSHDAQRPLVRAPQAHALESAQRRSPPHRTPSVRRHCCTKSARAAQTIGGACQKNRARDEFACHRSRVQPKIKWGCSSGAVATSPAGLSCCVCADVSHAKIPSSRFDRGWLGALGCGPDVAIPLGHHGRHLCRGVAGDGARRRTVTGATASL